MKMSRFDWDFHPLVDDVTDAIERGRIALKIGSTDHPRPEARLALHAVASFLEEEDGWPAGADPAFIAKVLRQAADTRMNP